MYIAIHNTVLKPISLFPLHHNNFYFIPTRNLMKRQISGWSSLFSGLDYWTGLLGSRKMPLYEENIEVNKTLTTALQVAQFMQAK